jgi:transposase
MRGKQNREEGLFTYVRLEELVPRDHILRSIDRWIDFSCIEEKTRDLYSHTGRPSVDPEVLIRMLVVGYLYGITSERRLCQDVQLNLAYRWFCGLGLEDKVPDHSTFTKNRYGRFGESDLFRALFEQIVGQAVAHGLVRGKHLTVDATTVQANASLDSLEPIMVSMSPDTYLGQVKEQNPVDGKTAEDEQGKRPKLSNETHRSRTDPDARLLSKPFQKTQLAYSDNVLMDNASRVIVDVEVTEPNLHQEGQVAGEMLERSRFVTGIAPATVAGDKAYGYGAAVRRICEAGVMPHVAQPVQGQWNAQGIFGKGDFSYDAQSDELICPAGRRLHKRTKHARNRQSEYAARLTDCRGCALKSQCTRTRYRVAHRHWDQAYLDRAAAARPTREWIVSQRYRKFIEHLFAEAKEIMGLRRARRRGLQQVREQCLMTATVQNIKRIVKTLEHALPGGFEAASAGIATRIRTSVALLYTAANHLVFPALMFFAPPRRSPERMAAQFSFGMA